MWYIEMGGMYNIKGQRVFGRKIFIDPDNISEVRKKFNNTDVYAFLLKDTLQREYKDTLLIDKNSQIHIESVDCSPQYFHHIIGVQYTRNSIDSIVINNPNVNNDATKQHLLIYFKHNI